MKIVNGGFTFRDGDDAVINMQRSITKQVNDYYIQVGAVFLKMSGKSPIDSDWYKSAFHDTNLQDWIDHEDKALHNVGFNLQDGWIDIDIDHSDPLYNKYMIAALDYNGIDTRFRFGRRSIGFPAHVLVQLGEAETLDFDNLRKFEPKAFLLNGERCMVEMRSYQVPTKGDVTEEKGRQTVMPGSVYTHDKLPSDYDISVWYGKDGLPATSISSVAVTTPRRGSFRHIVRSIAFATFVYAVKDEWVTGNRQATATKMAGWLARVVKDSYAMNNHEVISKEVWCPVDDDSIVEALLSFTCEQLGDDEPHMRLRTYRDARDKLERNPDAKIPGWPVIEGLLGGELVHALRTVFTPGSDVSVLTKLAERYIYDESDNTYIDRVRHRKGGAYSHSGEELMTRHKHEVVKMAGKSKEAFRLFEASDMRRRVDHRDMYPDLGAGGIYRFSAVGDILNDDMDDEDAVTTFNSWRGWPVTPANPVNDELMNDLVTRLDQLLAYLTRDNLEQIKWVKNWIAWTLQHPGKKQQIAWVCVGGQGVGKSFIGNTFMKSLMGRLWGSASPKVMDGAFSVEPFVDNMFVFIDEAKFSGDASIDEIKKLIRNVDVGGAEKFQSSRNYRIFSRIMFASNRYDLNVGQTGTIDRALFYTKAYDKDHLGMSEMEFRGWAERLKPWFTEFNELLERRDVREHYFAYFTSLPVTQAEVESIKYSSSNDAAIVNANISWSRRIAVAMLEDARMAHDDMDILYPFTVPEFNRRVVELAKEMGFRNVQGQRVLNEFMEAGIVNRYIDGTKAVLRLTYKWGDALDQFSAATGVTLEPHFVVTENDRGMNDTTLKDRVVWRGGKAHKFG